jgi:hypothetical protein
MLDELVGELLRIQTCSHLKGAKDKINNMVSDGTVPGEKGREAMKEIDDAARLNKCPGFPL